MGIHIFNQSYSILKAKLYFYRPNYGKTGASQMAPVVKNLPANAGDVRNVGWVPGLEDPLEEGMGTYSSILA